MLQITLAPAPVAYRQVDQRRRAFLVAAFQAGHHVHGPAATPDQRSLDEVVAQDMAAERLPSAQFRQAGLFGEGTGTDQRVVAPVIALRPVPPGNAVRDHRAVDPAGELLHPGEQCGAAGDDRQGLDQSGVGMCLQRGDQRDQRVTSHHAVGVQDQELRVGAAEPHHPLGDIAGLARGVLCPVPVEEGFCRIGADAQLQEGFLLGDPDLGVGGVAEDENVEQVGDIQCLQRCMDCVQASHHPRRRFVVGRHQQRGAGRGQGARHQQPSPAAGHDGDEPGQCAGEGQRDPGEQRDEQRQHDDRQRRRPVHRQHPIHLPRAEPGQHDRAADHQQTPPADTARG